MQHTKSIAISTFSSSFRTYTTCQVAYMSWSEVFPHIFVWGSCFWFCVPPSARPPARPPAFHTQLAHTQLVHTHNLLTHNLSTHNLLTHNLLTHNLSCPHTTCHHTTCSLTHILSSHNLQLAHAQLVHTQLAHTQLVLTQLGRRGTWRHPPSLCVAGVVLGDIHLHFAWQAWHLRHWAGSGGAPGRRGSLSGGRGTWWHRLSLCVAGVALGDIDAHFAWQAWHLRHWAGFGGALGFRCGAGRRGSFGVAGVALGDMDLHFAWQAWYLVTSTLTLRGRRGTYGTGPALVAHRVPKWRRGSRGSLRGTRGTWWHRLSLCVAGVALGDMDLHFAWQAWHLVTSTLTLRGRRGTYGTGPALVARLVLGVALGAAALLAWQAWHLATWTFTLRGRHGTWWHRRSLCVAGVALTALGRLWWRTGFPNDAVDAAALCVARVALGDIDCHFAWQAWHLATWTFTLRGTWWHRRSLCVAGVALAALGRLRWRAWF